MNCTQKEKYIYNMLEGTKFFIWINPTKAIFAVKLSTFRKDPNLGFTPQQKGEIFLLKCSSVILSLSIKNFLYRLVRIVGWAEDLDRVGPFIPQILTIFYVRPKYLFIKRFVFFVISEKSAEVEAHIMCLIDGCLVF